MIFTVGNGRSSVILESLVCGNDLIVSITGGDFPHIGAVSLALPSSIVGHSDSVGASASVLTVLGHKEDTISRNVSLTLARHLQKTVLVSCGIHIDNATWQEVQTSINNIDILVEKFLKSTYST